MKAPHIYIPSKGRPQCHTAKMLKDRGYEGKITIVVGNDDETRYEYVDIWGDMVTIFDKQKVASRIDIMDAHGDLLPTGAAPARQMILELGRRAQEGRFWMMDDDYKDIIIMHGDGTRSNATGKAVAEMLQSMSDFADNARVPITGFTINSFDNVTPLKFDHKVFTNYGISDVIPVQPWSGRQFEDAVHTISQARVGMPDFRFLYAYVVVDDNYADTSAGKVGTGGLSDLYSIGGDDSQALNMVRQVGYSVMAHPNGMSLVVRKNGELSKRFGVTQMVPKTLREEWCRA